MQSTSPWSIMRARVGLLPISPSYAMSVSVTSLQEISGYNHSLVDMQRSSIGSATACSRNERDTVAPCQVRSLSIYMPAIHAIGWHNFVKVHFRQPVTAALFTTLLRGNHQVMLRYATWHLCSAFVWLHAHQMAMTHSRLERSRQ